MAGGANVHPIPTPARGTKIGSLVVYGDEDAESAPLREYYVKGLIYQREMSVVYGEPGSGKSFLATYIARAIALAWGDEPRIFNRRLHGAHVLFMALEGASGFEKRIRALRQPGDEPCEHFHYIAQPVNLFSDPAAITDVLAVAKRYEIGLIVVDTLNRAMAGGSENDPADMGQFIRNLDLLRDKTNAHVMVIHHSGKDASRGMRGHSALLGAADLALEVKREEDSTRVITVAKAKDDSDVGKMAFALKVAELGIDADGDKITSCIVQELDSVPSGLKAKDAKDKLSAEERLWLQQIHELFAREGATQIVTPMPGLPAVPCVGRKVLREWVKIRGLVGTTEDIKQGPIQGTDRSKTHRILNKLKLAGRLAFHGNVFWLPEAVNRDASDLI